jgi:hypothetical protein
MSGKGYSSDRFHPDGHPKPARTPRRRDQTVHGRAWTLVCGITAARNLEEAVRRGPEQNQAVEEIVEETSSRINPRTRKMPPSSLGAFCHTSTRL